MAVSRIHHALYAIGISHLIHYLLNVTAVVNIFTIIAQAYVEMMLMKS